MRMKKEVCSVIQKLEAAGFEAYAVGGAVRDSLLGKEPFDWDVTTSALPEQVMELFGEEAIPTGLKHGTVTVLRQGERIEVTTYRKDGEYADHRHPVAVEFTPSLEEDLQRRDFTVNAMALTTEGEVIDPFGGQEDRKSGVLRAVGNAAQRFEEDALRILRGLRFASDTGFPSTAEKAWNIGTPTSPNPILPEWRTGVLTTFVCRWIILSLKRTKIPAFIWKTV